MNPAPRQSLEDRVTHAGMLVICAHFLFKVAGFAQTLAMGHWLTKSEYDSFTFAFTTCLFGVFLVGEEVIGPAMMPIFMRRLDEKNESGAWQFANTFLTLQFLLLIPTVLLIMLHPDWLVRFCTQWSDGDQPGAAATSTRFVHDLAPALFGLSIGSTTYVILNGYKRFFLAAFGDAVWKMAAVGGLIVAALFWTGGAAVKGLTLGLLLGSVLKVVTHLLAMRDKLRLIRPRLTLTDPALRAVFWLMLPLLVGIVFAKVRGMVNDVYVLSGIHSAGWIQANNMGRALQGSINWLVPYAFAIAVFPFFCELVDDNDEARMGQLITRSGRMLLVIFIPCAAVVAVLSRPLAAFIFKGGYFDDVSVQRTAISLACYILVLPASAIETLVMQAFFAHRRMVAITVVGVLFSFLSILISLAGIPFCGQNGLLLLGVVAGGFTLSRMLKSLVLVWMLRSNTPSAFPARETLAFLARTTLVAVLMAEVAWVGSHGAARFLHLHGRLQDLLRLSAGSLAALVVGAIACAVLRIREPREMLHWTLAKVRNRRRKPHSGGSDRE